MDQKEAIEKVKEYKKVLQEHFNVENVYLFGSYAKNKQREHSDIDVAVVVDKFEKDYLKFLSKFWKYSSKVEVLIEPVVFEKGDDPLGFLNEIQRTGIEV